MAKKLLSLSLILVVVLTAGVGALAQGGGTVWSSAYQIANLESTDATVHIAYYAQGASDVYEGDVTVTANGSKTIFPFTPGIYGDDITGPASFNGSAVLSSDKQIAAILNTQTGPGSSSFYGAATQGFSEGATAVSLPLVACNNGGFNTWFNIQNVGSGDASVTVNYAPGLYGVAYTDTVTIGQYQAKTFDQEAGSTTGTADCGDLADVTSSKFVGGASVTSDQPIVATVMFLGTGSIKAVQGYNAFTGGAEAINLPLIMANNSTYYTSIQIQNAGTGDASVVIGYGPNTSTGGTPTNETYTISAGGSETIIHLGSVFSQNDWDVVGAYVGGATITQDGTTEPLVAVVNQNSTQYTSLGSTYEGMDPTGATTTINLPLVAAYNAGYLTGIQVQAVEADTDVTLTYSENSVEAGEIPTADTFTLVAAGDSKTLIQTGVPGPLTGVNDWRDAIGQYVGAATITADKPILAIVNFNGPAAGDTFYTYDGFAQ